MFLVKNPSFLCSTFCFFYLFVYSLDWFPHSVSFLCLFVWFPPLQHTHTHTAVFRCRWWVVWSRLFPPLLSVGGKSSVAQAGTVARLQQSSDWTREHSLQTRVTSSRETASASGLRERVEDITAAMLSSPTPWPCHSRQAGWSRDARMFVALCGWMISYANALVRGRGHGEDDGMTLWRWIWFHFCCGRNVKSQTVSPAAGGKNNVYQ